MIGTTKSQKLKTFVADSPSSSCSTESSFVTVAKKTVEGENQVESPPSRIELGFDPQNLPLSRQADGLRVWVDSGSSKHFVDPGLIRGVANKMHFFKYSIWSPDENKRCRR